MHSRWRDRTPIPIPVMNRQNTKPVKSVTNALHIDPIPVINKVITSISRLPNRSESGVSA